MKEKEKKDEIWFEKMTVEIISKDMIHYLVREHSKEEVNNLLKEQPVGIKVNDLISYVINQDLLSIWSENGQNSLNNDGLIYLPLSKKLLNIREIKESNVQYQ